MKCNHIGNLSGEKYEKMLEQSRRVYGIDGLAPTQTAHGGGNIETKIGYDEHCEFRIRKLTPRECWRLMGFDDEDFDKASAVCSNSQLYKQAGNSIVVNVLETLLVNLLLDELLEVDT